MLSVQKPAVAPHVATAALAVYPALQVYVLHCVSQHSASEHAVGSAPHVAEAAFLVKPAAALHTYPPQVASQQSVVVQRAGDVPQTMVPAVALCTNPVVQPPYAEQRAWVSQQTAVVHVAMLAPQTMRLGFTFSWNPTPHVAGEAWHVASQHTASLHAGWMAPSHCSAGAVAFSWNPVLHAFHAVHDFCTVCASHRCTQSNANNTTTEDFTISVLPLSGGALDLQWCEG